MQCNASSWIQFNWWISMHCSFPSHPSFSWSMHALYCCNRHGWLVSTSWTSPHSRPVYVWGGVVIFECHVLHAYAWTSWRLRACAPMRPGHDQKEQINISVSIYLYFYSILPVDYYNLPTAVRTKLDVHGACLHSYMNAKTNFSNRRSLLLNNHIHVTLYITTLL